MRFAIAYTPAGGKKGKTMMILFIAMLGIFDLFLVIAVMTLEKRGVEDE